MRATEQQLYRAILERRASVVVIGQGYVGLTLAAAAAQIGFTVTGIDTDHARIASLAGGACPVPGVDPAAVAAAFATGSLTFTTSLDEIAGADVVLICVPTPLTNATPDVRHIEEACDAIAERLQPGHLVVLESTTYPGTTDEVVAPRMAARGLVPGRDVLIAYSPERIDPGNPEFGLENTPKIVGGMTPAAARAATAFYEQICAKVITVSSCRSAELAKLLENTYRHVNIALVNEMAIMCHEMGIDVWEVLHATESKPFGYMRFDPGPGVGGHCIPVDPTYLAWKVRAAADQRFHMIETAEDVNARMPVWVADRIAETINRQSKSVRGATVLVLGVSYKPGIGDVRESPAIKVIASLMRKGVRVRYHDPFVPSVEAGGRTLRSVTLNGRELAGADCVALLTPHPSYDLDWLIDHARVLFDARNASNGRRASNVVRL
jgi:UDP-N-acetyl-D-glucosamine dehydrogenase